MTQEEKLELKRLDEEFASCSIKAQYGIAHQYEEMLEMEDGARLRTIIYRTEKAQAAPTIVVRTCYPNNDYLYRKNAEEYSKRGFHYIYQYCRGTGGSEGSWEPNVNERSDGKRTLDWIAKQEWVQNIGYFGCSYLSLTGWAIADIIPEKVKTMYLTHYGTHRHVSAYQDGLFRHDVLTAWAMENAGFPVTADYLESCRYRPQIEVDEAMWGGKLDWYRDWISASDREDPYWQQGFWSMLREIPSKVKVPIYLGEGWYDHHLGSAIETWKSLPKEIKAKSRLVIGAWNHGFYVAVQDRQGTHFENSDTLRAFAWFYRVLVEEKEPEAGIDYYIIGEDRWDRRQTFEIQDQQRKRFYLGEKKNGFYSLEEENSKVGEYLTWTFDPEDPVPTHGAESLLHTNTEQGSLLQPQPGYRSDVISCLSEPLTEDLTIIGKVKMVLNVSADVDDTSFAFKLMEVFPDGRAYNIRTGITTLGYRNQSDRRQSYTAGQKVEISIDTWDVAWKVSKGSRLRVDLTSSDFPQYSVHSNYAGPWAQQKKTQAAHLQVYFGGYEESFLELPVDRR